MELIQGDARALTGIMVNQEEKPVYNGTTVPLTSSSSGAAAVSPLSCTTCNNKIKQYNANGQIQEIVNVIKQQDKNDNNATDLFSQLPARSPVDLEFKDLSYTVNEGFIKRTPKEILHNVGGKFPGSQLIAIMGPSGAGKSTLLDVLSGFKTTGVTGAVLMNGRPRDLNAFRRQTCYITQDDRLHELLTVVENMRCAAELKLGKNLSYELKERRIEEILLILGLYEHSDTLAKKLSGGQKKRLSIALELINNPTIMFLDEPTTGLDSYSCCRVIDLLQKLASQGRTIICTIHQPTAKLFQNFDLVYVLSAGKCVYQGGTSKLVKFLQEVDLPCPKYHNPADYIIELACREYGEDKVDYLCKEMQNGRNIEWFEDPSKICKAEDLMRKNPVPPKTKARSLEDTTTWNQIKILMYMEFMKLKRDSTLSHLRIAVNIFLAIVLGLLYMDAGNEGSRVVDNYYLLFAILMHHSMTTMMLTVLTFPMEMNILLKEHFNRWYSLKSYYAAVSLLDLPLSTFCCLIFTIIIYFLSDQPLEMFRFVMFFAISLLIVFIGQSTGLIIGAWFSVVNGTFFAPVLMVPIMMFAGFGVNLRDIPYYLKWGTHLSYLRYALEGYVGSIYGEKREALECERMIYCHYRHPEKFLYEVAMRGDKFWFNFYALVIIIVLLRLGAYVVLKLKIKSEK
ncbi:ATP-binding cassette sub-family G member 4 [Condylostylus longicornis]|uniref:ATP-binding cassette sub-family G member 4 n=1 Tax=Condylostylus longicornis TaxID=2530218 RepID=UPI00244DE276|nr:ATP-binding cassette sub-family G member 4 [Condylostylus longicornis]